MSTFARLPHPCSWTYVCVGAGAGRRCACMPKPSCMHTRTPCALPRWPSGRLAVWPQPRVLKKCRVEGGVLRRRAERACAPTPTKTEKPGLTLGESGARGAACCRCDSMPMPAAHPVTGWTGPSSFSMAVAAGVSRELCVGTRYVVPAGLDGPAAHPPPPAAAFPSRAPTVKSTPRPGPDPPRSAITVLTRLCPRQPFPPEHKAGRESASRQGGRAGEHPAWARLCCVVLSRGRGGCRHDGALSPWSSGPCLSSACGPAGVSAHARAPVRVECATGCLDLQGILGGFLWDEPPPHCPGSSYPQHHSLLVTFFFFCSVVRRGVHGFG